MPPVPHSSPAVTSSAKPRRVARAREREVMAESDTDVLQRRRGKRGVGAGRHGDAVVTAARPCGGAVRAPLGGDGRGRDEAPGLMSHGSTLAHGAVTAGCGPARAVIGGNAAADGCV
ncbi:hypothetical protein GCM10022205_60890 [Spinactinospora alkalitolerans]